MILNRLGRALARQDWFTVMVEIAIVVLGIFIALRADQWNEDRKLRQQEAAYLVAIADDLRSMEAELDHRMADRQQRREAMIRGLRALESCEDTPQARAEGRVHVDDLLTRLETEPGARY